MPADSSRQHGKFVVPLNTDPFALEDFAPESEPESGPKSTQNTAPAAMVPPAPVSPAVDTDQFRFPAHEYGPVVSDRRHDTSPVPYGAAFRFVAAVALVAMSAVAGYLAISSDHHVADLNEQVARIQPDSALGTTGTLSATPPSIATPSPSDLSGSWEVVNLVEDSSYAAYEGLRLGYRLQLQQKGARINGRGEKLSENGRSIPAAARSPIELNGTINGNTVRLAFTERGARRSSVGTFDLQWTEDGDLRGQFESDAASSRGTTVARKVPAAGVRR